MADPIPFKPRAVRGVGDIVSAAKAFLTAKQAANCSPNTIDAYRRDLEQFAGFLLRADATELHHVRVTDVDDWVQALQAGEGNSPRTARRKLATVREFLRWCVKRNLVRTNVADQAERVKVNVAPVVAPAPQTVRRFLDAIDTSRAIGIRDRAMFELMADTALRVSGLRSLDLYDPDQPPLCAVLPNDVVAYRAKGGDIKETVMTGASTRRWLDRWLEVRDRFAGRRPVPALFIGERGERLTRAAIHARIKTWGLAAGLPHLHCHLLRHSRLGAAMEHGDVHLAQMLAGHAHKSTTSDLYGQQEAAGLRRRLRAEVPFDGGAACDS